jgi:hypothetical protein
MRALLSVAALSLSLLSFAWRGTVAMTASQGDAVAGAPAAPAKPPGKPAGPSADSDAAAAKHAKRTACLKEAKAKKLVGAKKNAFVQECVGPP